MKVLSSLALIGLATAVWAQEPDVAALAGLDVHLNIQSSTVMLRTLRNTSKASDAVKAEVDKLLDEGAGFLARGNTGEVRRRIYHADTLLGGKAWTPTDEYAAALLLRTDTQIADPARHLVARLEQIYPAGYQPKTGLRLHVTVHEPVPSRSGPRPGKVLRDGGIIEGVSRD